MPPQVLKPSPLEIHKRHGHKNIPPSRNLITSATDSLSSLISFPNCDGTTVDYSTVKYEDTNMMQRWKMKLLGFKFTVIHIPR